MTKTSVFHKIMNYFNGDEGKQWHCGDYHLNHKQMMREAPSLYIVQHLLEAGAIVKAYDPIAIKEAKHHFSDTISYCEDQ
jgi:UDPglucose 6-dehydrogenase